MKIENIFFSKLKRESRIKVKFLRKMLVDSSGETQSWAKITLFDNVSLFCSL